MISYEGKIRMRIPRIDCLNTELAQVQVHGGGNLFVQIFYIKN